MIIGVTGAVVGLVARVDVHPRGDQVWLAHVDCGNGLSPQIVFGGYLKLVEGDLVPVAPPGSQATVLCPEEAMIRKKKMRARNYRGQRSHGMLCSLGELGWIWRGPDEVAVLRKLPLGYPLDDLPRERLPDVVIGWQRAWKIAQGASPAEADGPLGY